MNPDVVQLVCAYLRSVDAIAALVDDRVATLTPPTTDEPWVRVSLLDERTHPSSRALHLTHGLIQLDCYAGTLRSGAQAQASLLARTARQALHVMRETQFDNAVVSSVTLGSLRHLPDEVLAPSRERYILTAEIHAHP